MLFCLFLQLSCQDTIVSLILRTGIPQLKEYVQLVQS